MLPEVNWKNNLKYKELPTIEVGDLVLLAVERTSAYLVRAEVIDTNDEQIAGKVVDIFTGAGDMLTGGDLLKFMGKTIGFHRSMVSNVVKKPT